MAITDFFPHIANEDSLLTGASPKHEIADKYMSEGNRGYTEITGKERAKRAGANAKAKEAKAKTKSTLYDTTESVTEKRNEDDSIGITVLPEDIVIEDPGPQDWPWVLWNSEEAPKLTLQQKRELRLLFWSDRNHNSTRPQRGKRCPPIVKPYRLHPDGSLQEAAWYQHPPPYNRVIKIPMNRSWRNLISPFHSVRTQKSCHRAGFDMRSSQPLLPGRSTAMKSDSTSSVIKQRNSCVDARSSGSCWYRLTWLWDSMLWGIPLVFSLKIIALVGVIWILTLGTYQQIGEMSDQDDKDPVVWHDAFVVTLKNFLRWLVESVIVDPFYSRADESNER